MTAEPTRLFQGLAPLLVNRTVLMTVAADGKGLLTLNVIPKKVKDDESDALTTALCITASPEELDRDLAAQLREFTDVHAKAATNIQQVKDELAAAEKAEREAADERRAKKTKGKVVPPTGADMKPESVKPVGSGQTSLGLFDQADGEPEENSPASAGVAVEQGQVTPKRTIIRTDDHHHRSRNSPDQEKERNMRYGPYRHEDDQSFPIQWDSLA